MSAELVEPLVAEEPIIHEEQPTIVAPAAFAWEGAEQARDGETYVERAYRGPTPENPVAIAQEAAEARRVPGQA